MTFQDHATLKFHHTKVHETRTKEEQQVHKQVMRTRTEAHLKYPKVLCGRHADVSHVWKLQLFRQDSAYVLFMKTSAPLAILPQLFNLIQAWNAKKAKDPASPGLPLRVVLLGGLLQQIEQRIKQLDTDESLRRQSKEDKLLSEADCFNYLEYQRRRATRFRREVRDSQNQCHGNDSGAPRIHPDATSGASVPRLSQAHSRRHRGSSSVHAGDLQQGRSSTASLQPVRQARAQRHHASGGGQPQTRQDPALTLGASFGQDCALKALCLLNRSKYCYANALVIILLHIRDRSAEPLYPQGVDSFFLDLLRASSRHLWDDPRVEKSGSGLEASSSATRRS